MPLNPSIFLANLQSARAACPFPMVGLQFDRLAAGIAMSVAGWAISQPQNVALQGTASGTVGGGTIPSGKLVVPPNPSLVIGALASAGLGGPLGVSLGTIVGTAVPSAFTLSGSYLGVSPGVGVGADVSKVVVSNPATLIALLQSNLAALSGPGIAMPLMAVGLGNGIAGCVALGFGTGSVVGVPGPSAGVTLTTSVVV